MKNHAVRCLIAVVVMFMSRNDYRPYRKALPRCRRQRAHDVTCSSWDSPSAIRSASC
jgi:hypothetical protein